MASRHLFCNCALHNSLARARATPAAARLKRANHGAGEWTNDGERAATSPGSSAPTPAIRPRASSNKLYRQNLAKGQTGLSIAFDLPTQTGFDSDHILARGEVGKVGVAISHIGDMRALFEDIPLASMNTSMTINATAPWLMALYIAVADEQGAPRAQLQGTTQNDIIKEYLARGSYVFPPEASLRLTKDMIVFGGPRDAEVEPDERVLLPPAGSGRDAGPGAFLRARHGDRRARTGPPIGRGRRSGVRGGRRPDFVLRQRRHALRDRTRQNARLRRIVGRDHARSLRRAGSRQASLPLRRPGQFARTDRAAA